MNEHKSYRNTWAEVSLRALEKNIVALKGLLPANSKMMGVVKADGYGHGSVETAKVAIKTGVDFLMVALLEEAILLRKAGIDVPILVIGRVSPAHAVVAADFSITLTVFDLAWLRAVADEVLPRTLSIHLEFETGMGRTGICSEAELIAILDEVSRNNQLNITGVYTHLATADEAESTYYEAQKQKFSKWLGTLSAKFNQEVLIHLGNSAAGIQYPTEMKHYTRFGVAIYGLYPSEAMAQLGVVELEEAFTLYSELMQVKYVKKGSNISYGSTYVAAEDEWIGTIPIGYADGWRRGLQGFHVLVDGKSMPIVGRVCMDQTMITLDKQYDIGTKVTLIGRDGSERITVDDVATHLNTINYEVTCMISNRVPRVFVE